MRQMLTAVACLAAALPLAWTGVAGTYVGVAMLLAMAEQGVPADKEPPFKDGEP